MLQQRLQRDDPVSAERAGRGGGLPGGADAGLLREAGLLQLRLGAVLHKLTAKGVSANSHADTCSKVRLECEKEVWRKDIIV